MSHHLNSGHHKDNKVQDPDKAFARGVSDHRRGKSITEVPYADHTMSTAWELGWQLARLRKNQSEK